MNIMGGKNVRKELCFKILKRKTIHHFSFYQCQCGITNKQKAIHCHATRQERFIKYIIIFDIFHIKKMYTCFFFYE